MAPDVRELKGLRALVTGGTKGIRHAIAGRLNESGATVHMSPSSFRQHFRALTGLSPLQYQKHCAYRKRGN